MVRRIFGTISVENIRPPGTMLRVVAWDADVDEDDHMGITHISEDGSYSIQYEDEKWDWAPSIVSASWRPDIYIVVEWFDSVTALWRPISKSKVYSNQDVREDREINLSVRIPSTSANTVYGKVTNKLGEPLEGFTVMAWDEDPSALRALSTGIEDSGEPSATGKRESANFLGSAVTDSNGEYRIQFAGSWWEQVRVRGLGARIGTWWRPDIFIRVLKKAGAGVLYRSPTHQNILHITGIRIDAKIDLP